MVCAYSDANLDGDLRFVPTPGIALVEEFNSIERVLQPACEPRRDEQVDLADPRIIDAIWTDCIDPLPAPTCLKQDQIVFLPGNGSLTEQVCSGIEVVDITLFAPLCRIKAPYLC